MESFEKTIFIGWDEKGGKIHPNKENQIISQLTENILTEVAVREGGWTFLYKHPTDHTFWELTHPHGDFHGGGPQRLEHVSIAYVKKHYPDFKS